MKDQFQGLPKMQLRELKVVEFASVLAGPLVGTFFAELGAEVIKIENPKAGGDATRNWKTASENRKTEISAYYASANFGKQVRFIDLSSEEGRRKAIGLCREADVVITNFQPDTASKLGVDKDSLRDVNSTAIIAELVSDEQNPQRPAYDVLLQASTGYLSMTGHPGGRRAKIPIALIDVLAAHQLREGILLALYERTFDGRGRSVRASLVGAALGGLINQASAYLMNGDIAQPMGTQHPSIAPYGDIFTTSDKVDFILAVGTNEQFSRLLDVLEVEDGKSGFDTNISRVSKREQLVEFLNGLFSNWSSEALFEQLDRQNIPFSPIHTIDRVLDDPKRAEFILEERHGNTLCRKTRSVNFRVFGEA